MGRSIRERFVVEPGTAAGIAERSTTRTPGVRSRSKAERHTADLQAILADWQETLYAERARSLLVVLQGMDTSGKDGTIKHAMASLSPSAMAVTAFRQPTPQELRHHFLWRIRRALPAPGQIGIFNRSHYEDVVVVRVKRLVPTAEWSSRFEQINAFERQLAKGGTTLLKVFLHISRDEQRRRLLARLDDPTKRWKFNPNDLDDRARWDEFQAAYDDALTRCSTDAGPWYVVPADRKWYRNWAVSGLLAETFEEMAPDYPKPELDLAALRARLLAD